MTFIKVAYLIVTRSFPGLLKQVSYDRTLTSHQPGMNWDYFIFLDQAAKGEEAKQLPRYCNGVFGRKLFAWLWLVKHAKHYDFVIVRHMEFDPFALVFAWFVPNRVLIHHSKEVLELRLIRSGWKGYAASLLEAFTGRVATHTATALVGVTREIAQYQKRFRELPEDYPIGFFPNGVIVDSLPLLGDKRLSSPPTLAFMCGTFAAWHGLDRLLDSLLVHYACDNPIPIRLHLIGRLSKSHLAHVSRVNAFSSSESVTVHGTLNQTDYLNILQECHIGIGSLAMDRIQLNEGATLKVREMLAMGLPIYSGHADTALPPDFPYYRIGRPGIPSILKFFKILGNVSRLSVREASRIYVDKAVWINEFSDFLRGLNIAT